MSFEESIKILYIVLAFVWMYSFVSILRSHNRRIIKLILIILIIVIPPVGLIYPMKFLVSPAVKVVKYDVQGSGKRLNIFARVSKGLFGWLFEKPS